MTQKLTFPSAKEAARRAIINKKKIEQKNKKSPKQETQEQSKSQRKLLAEAKLYLQEEGLEEKVKQDILEAVGEGRRNCQAALQSTGDGDRALLHELALGLLLKVLRLKKLGYKAEVKLKEETTHLEHVEAGGGTEEYTNVWLQVEF